MSRSLDRRRFLAALGGAVALPPVLAACGALDPSASRQEQGAPETTTLRAGVLPIVGAAPLSLGVQNGGFQRAGLTVTPQRIQSGALSLPALVAGDYDVLFSNHVSTIAAKAQDIDVVIVAEASRARPNNFGVVTMPDSPLTGPAALAGRTIGVNALNNIATLTISSVLGVNGVRPDQLTFVEIPFPQMAATLQARRIDAAFLPEPFLTAAERTLGVRTLLDPTSGPTADLPIDGYVVTRAFADRFPETVRTFRTALVDAQQQAADRTVLDPLLVSSTGADPAIAPLISASAYPTSLNPVGIQRVADLMLQFGAVPAPVDVRSMVLA